MKKIIIVSLALASCLALAPEPWEAQTDLPCEGLATFYAPGLMETVAQYRLFAGHIELCPHCVGYIAMPRKGDLGRLVNLEFTPGVIIGPFEVADVAGALDFERFVSTNHLVEIAYPLAMQLKMRGPIWVRVWPVGGEPEGNLDERSYSGRDRHIDRTCQ